MAEPLSGAEIDEAEATITASMRTTKPTTASSPPSGGWKPRTGRCARKGMRLLKFATPPCRRP